MPESQRIDDLFFRAIELSPRERGTFLDDACADDPGLRSEIESLLAADDSAHDFLDAPISIPDLANLGDASADPQIGTEVGPWRLCEPIGSGGMGKVYRAERADTHFKKEVAVKLLRSGLDTEDLLARFRSERQVLAHLEHPNIARLIDGGIAESGLPYIAMEYVSGEPIDRHADKHGLSIDERLRLFTEVCAAVAYAHRNLVVHRDLKPSNILVDSQGKVKLLDFGIAKVLVPDSQDQTLTHAGLQAMTPRYASPEQVRGQPVTTATDVYSLGVVLYELLTGARPYEIEKLTPGEVERIVCEQEPTRPSLVAAKSDSAIGNAEGGPQAWSHRLAGDLDKIVSMALRKEPDRRYGSVEQFADDIGRHLDGYPVHARPNTLRYRTAKFLARNKVAVAATSVLAITMVAAVVTSTALYVRTQSAKEEAQTQKASAQEITAYLREMLEGADPFKSYEKDLKVREMLDQASERIGTELGDEAAAALHSTVGTAYKNVAEFGKAQTHLEAAVDFYRTQSTPTRDGIGARRALGNLHLEMNQLDVADDVLTKALAETRRLDGPDRVEESLCLRALGTLRGKQGSYEESENLHRKAIEISEEHQGGRTHERMGGLNDLAMLLVQRGRYEEAVELSHEALDIAREIKGERSFETAQLLQNAGWALSQIPNSQGSLHHIAEAIDIYEDLFPEDHPRLMSARVNYALGLRKEGRLDEAIEIIERQVDLARKKLGPDHGDVATYVANLGFMVGQRGDHLESARYHAEAREIYTKSLGASHPWVAITLFNEANMRHAAGQLREARTICRESLRIRREVLRESHPDVARSLHLLARIALDENRYDEAEPLIREAVEIRIGELGGEHVMTCRSQIVLAKTLAGQGSRDEAEALFLKTKSTLEASGNEDNLRELERIIDEFYGS